MNPPLRQLLRRAERQLTGAGIGDSRIEADLVWMTALEVDRVELYARLWGATPTRSFGPLPLNLSGGAGRRRTERPSSAPVAATLNLVSARRRRIWL